MIATLRAAIDDFLIRQDRAKGGTPIDGRFHLISQAIAVLIRSYREGTLLLNVRRNRQFGDGSAALLCGVVPSVIDLQEDPLRPLEIAWIGRVHFAVPVVAETEHLDLTTECLDVSLGGGARVRTGLDGVLLSGQAESVPTHRMQDVAAPHSLVTSQDVGRGVALRMADVQTGA